MVEFLAIAHAGDVGDARSGASPKRLARFEALFGRFSIIPYRHLDLDLARVLEDLRVPPGNRLEALKRGPRRTRWRR